MASQILYSKICSSSLLKSKTSPNYPKFFVILPTPTNDAKLQIPWSYLRFQTFMGTIRRISLSKGRKKGKIVSYLSHRKHGPHIKTQTNLYKSLVRSLFDYASPVLLSISNKLKTKLESTQNKFLRAILHAFKSIPINQLQLELGVEPLNQRQESLAAHYGQNLHISPSSPQYRTHFKTRTPETTLETKIFS